MRQDHVRNAKASIQKLLPILHGINQRNLCSSHQIVGVEVKAHYRRRQIPLIRPFPRHFQQAGMPQMDPVEESQSNYTTFYFLQPSFTSKKLFTVRSTPLWHWPSIKNSLPGP